jgi:predicted nucleic acid-binding protein
MKRVLLDTNIYGKMVETGNYEIISKLGKHTFLSIGLVIYGADVIRKELRATSKNLRQKGKKIRPLLLTLYDSIISGHNIEETPKMGTLAAHYFRAYKEFEGSVGNEEIFNDFLIVAMASVKGLDVVYSEDSRTLASEKARKAYRVVNGIYGLKTPNLEPYAEFMREIKRLLP